MDRVSKQIIASIVASGIIAPIVSILVLKLMQNIEEKNKKMRYIQWY